MDIHDPLPVIDSPPLSHDLEACDLLDPNPDIFSLFCHYNNTYFDRLLHACTVSWSSSRMTLCAGICIYSEGSCCIRLSEPLLKFRPSRNLKETLLHEMIHAYLWLTDNNKDHDDHGPCFQAKMKEINTSAVEDLQRPEGGYHISVYHNFKEEVNIYRRHQWLCLSCGDLIKRANNRAPSKSDCYKGIGRISECEVARCHWHNHQQQCGGEYTKVAEPEGYKDKRRKVQKLEDNKSLEAAERKKLMVSEYSRHKRVDGPFVHKDSSLEKFFVVKTEGDTCDWNALKVIEDPDCEFLENPTENDKKTRKAKKREYKADETGEQTPPAKREGHRRLMSKKQQDEELDSEEYTVIIGWKPWCAYEGEEDERNVELLFNKRSQRKKAQSVHSLVEGSGERSMTSSFYGNNLECVNTNSIDGFRVSLVSSDIAACQNMDQRASEGDVPSVSSHGDDHRTRFNSGMSEVVMQQNDEREAERKHNHDIYIEDGSPRSGIAEEALADDTMQRSFGRLQKNQHATDLEGPSAICPICQGVLPGNIEDRDFNMRFNQHIDACIQI